MYTFLRVQVLYARPFWISVAFFAVLRLFFCTYRKSINSPLGILFDFLSNVFNDKNAQFLFFFLNIFRIFNATFNHSSNYYDDNLMTIKEKNVQDSGDENPHPPFDSLRDSDGTPPLCYEIHEGWIHRAVELILCIPSLKGAWQDNGEV